MYMVILTGACATAKNYSDTDNPRLSETLPKSRGTPIQVSVKESSKACSQPARSVKVLCGFLIVTWPLDNKGCP